MGFFWLVWLRIGNLVGFFGSCFIYFIWVLLFGRGFRLDDGRVYFFGGFCELGLIG